jgi:homoserine/homoserine lactone efflux protein
MTFQAWFIFTSFWSICVITPGPNAVNCISNGVIFGMRRSMWAVLAILTQALAFLLLSAFGITALLAASTVTFSAAKISGAVFLIFLGVRGWMNVTVTPKKNIRVGSIYGKALAIATINAKSLAVYLAAFTQFVQPDIPIWDQMFYIIPTALCLTAISYTGYTSLGAALGKTAMVRILNVSMRRGLALCFVFYGVILGLSALQAGAAV